MKQRHHYSTTILFCALLFPILLLSGCGSTVTKAERDGFFFDTAVSILVNAKDAEKLADGCIDICAEMEKTLSAHNPESELYAVNHRETDSVQISDDLRDCIAKALEYCELSDGALDITIYPVSSLWEFHTDNPVLPDEKDIRDGLKKIDYRKIHLDGSTLSFDSPDTMIDLGAVAKGYISGKLAEYLVSNGCRSALINLGGNVRTIGTKPDGTDWKIGIQKPFEDRGTVAFVKEVKDACVITSGTYERTFTVDGKLYHHILDPMTGYPAETELGSITVQGVDDEACDAVATLAFLVGKERTLEIIGKADLAVSVTALDPAGNAEVWKS